MKNKKIDWDNLGFNAHETKSMFRANYTPEDNWQVEGLIPYGDVSLSPASTVLNYGQGIFEGTKAYQTSRDRVVSFRQKIMRTGFHHLLRECVSHHYQEGYLKKLFRS